MEATTNKDRQAELQKLLGQKDLTAYDNVVLTEEETFVALFEARRKKDAAQKNAAYWKKVNEPIVYPKYTPRELYKIFQLANPNFVLDKWNRDIVRYLVHYFTETKSELYPDMNFKKGLFVFGNPGCGKTHLMEWFQSNQSKPYLKITCRQISYDYSKHGTDSILRYNGIIRTSSLEKNFGFKEMGLCFDDLGTEDDKSHTNEKTKWVSNKTNVMADILLNRYENQNLFPLTHLTTNLDGDEIEQRYGTRVRSRFKEMFNVIAFDVNAPDRRA